MIYGLCVSSLFSVFGFQLSQRNVRVVGFYIGGGCVLLCCFVVVVVV